MKGKVPESQLLRSIGLHAQRNDGKDEVSTTSTRALFFFNRDATDVLTICCHSFSIGSVPTGRATICHSCNDSGFGEANLYRLFARNATVVLVVSSTDAAQDSIPRGVVLGRVGVAGEPEISLEHLFES